MKPLPTECERRALASETWTKWYASSRSKARFFRGVKGDYGWFQRKDAKAQGRKERLRMTLCGFAFIFCAVFDAGPNVALWLLRYEI